MTDSELLEGLKNRSEKTFAFFYKRILPDVKNFIKRNSGDDDDAKDVFQDALLALLHNIDKGRYNQQNLKGYFMIIVRNKWFDRLDRGEGIGGQAELPDRGEEDPEIKIGPRLSDYLKKALGNLGDPCRALIVGTVVFKKSMEEMARRFGYASAHSARQQKLQCLKKLRLLVDPGIIAGLN